MSLKLHHSWWTHLPALACIVATITVSAFALAHAPLQVPVHYGWDGQPNRWGSRDDLAVVVMIFVALQVLNLAVSVALDEVIARLTRRRRHNWAAMIDEGLIGCLMGIAIRLVTHPCGPHPVMTVFGWGLGFSVLPLAAAAVVVWLRPYHPLASQ